MLYKMAYSDFFQNNLSVLQGGAHHFVAPSTLGELKVRRIMLMKSCEHCLDKRRTRGSYDDVALREGRAAILMMSRFSADSFHIDSYMKAQESPLEG